MKTEETKHCLNPGCNKRLVGRSDKRFCDVECKNQYHRLNKTDFEEGFERVIKILKKNRAVLQAIKGEKETVRTTLDKLIAQGFDNDYLTQVKKIRSKVYYFSFDHGYRLEESGEVTVVRAFKWG